MILHLLERFKNRGLHICVLGSRDSTAVPDGLYNGLDFRTRQIFSLDDSRCTAHHLATG